MNKAQADKLSLEIYLKEIKTKAWLEYQSFYRGFEVCHDILHERTLGLDESVLKLTKDKITLEAQLESCNARLSQAVEGLERIEKQHDYKEHICVDSVAMRDIAREVLGRVSG